ncbi:SpaA isopeptide-forming pilin-related protein [Leifsonia shinshuensis]|uniref:DUF7927 domain-containing protein n=1 Tax=Leifsonia shinshuensis TaxID=150026 RepID=UPI002864D8DD|nr:SpaA isopeptide-forming pilin-related protein [Leifsonia shinshuensis]MDR6970611.1 putative repeat protein (TIGR01451 family) [Leifsonia shinshuensis]
MAHRLGPAARRPRACWAAACLVLCAAVGVVAAALVAPPPLAAASTTALSTIQATGTDTENGSRAAAPDAPGGPATGTARPGDTVSWVVGYQNNSDAPAEVSLTDVLTRAGTYVPGSLVLPPPSNPAGAVTPQYSTNGGVSWATGAPPADATGVGFRASGMLPRTQQASPPFTISPPVDLRVAGGDAYNAVVHNGMIYAIWHHSSGAIVYCATPTGATCPGWPTSSNVQSWSSTTGTPIGTGIVYPGKSAQQNGTWLEGTRLHWYMGPDDNSGVVIACLDLATTTPTSCGLSSVPIGATTSNTQVAATIGGTGLPASDGNTWASAVGSGSAYLVCITPSSATCGQVRLTTGVTTANVYTSAVFGDHVFASVQLTSAGSWQTYCYDLASKALCAGSWPVATSSSLAKAGTPFAPRLSATGALSGICTLANGTGTTSACWSLTGVAQPTNPYSGTGAIVGAGGNGSGDVFTIGTKVYAPAGDVVTCLDFGRYSGSGTVPTCTGFTKPANSKNYTTRPATSFTPDCLVATGDGGQITFFDAVTGGACIPPATTSVTVKPESFYCGTGAASFHLWHALSLSGLDTAAYRTGSVTLKDQNGSVIPGWHDRALTLNAGALAWEISDIPRTVTQLTASVTLNGVTDIGNVRGAQIVVAWWGDPPQMCFATTAPASTCDDAAPPTLSNSASAVTTSAAGSDAPNGNTTGAAVFQVSQDPARCSLALTKTSSVKDARPGDRVEYEILIRNTGSQAYAEAVVTDDLSDVLAEATLADDQRATTGTVTYVAPTLRWTGSLPPGGSATITYSVIVRSPDPGDHELVNAVVSPSPGSNCPAGSNDPACTATVTVEVVDATWRKTDATAAKNVLAGSEWTLTPVDGSGRATGPATAVADCVTAADGDCPGADRDPVAGLFRVTGLGPGTYQLVETRAPEGFLRDLRPIPVVVSRTDSAVALPDIANTQLPVPALPFTGGLGTDTLTVAGGGTLGAAGVLGSCLLLRRRRAG